MRPRPGQHEHHRRGHVLRSHHPGERRHVRGPSAAHREVGRDAPSRRAVVEFEYDETTARLAYTVTPSAASRIAAVWIHTGTLDKPGAARHQLVDLNRSLSGAVTLSAADRRDVADGKLFVRVYDTEGGVSGEALRLARP